MVDPDGLRTKNETRKTKNQEPTTRPSHFDVLLLGPFALFRDGSAVDTGGWQRKVHALFRILATSPGHRRSREELVDLLWPDAELDAGQRNLRVVLHMLRKGLGEGGTVSSELGRVGLNPAFEWDIDLERFAPPPSAARLTL